MADAFWKNQLLGKPPLLLLPTDRPRTSTASPLFNVPLTLSAEVTTKLAAIGAAATADLSATRGNALSWTVLAVFQVLLSRYSRQDDITVGTSPLIGGAELLPLRVDLDNKPTFKGLVGQNARLALSILDHAGVSIKQLAEAAGADKFDFSLGTHPVFQVACLLDGGEDATRLAHGWNLDVLLELREVDGTLQGHLCGKDTFFAQGTIERAAKHFKTLVGSILELADKPIVELDFVDDEERQLVMHTFNNTERVLPPPYEGATIHGLFEHWANVTPDARAISYEGTYYTYRQLDERANQVARFLEANGVVEGQPVGVMLERSLELMVAMMGVLKAGGAFVPMDPEYPEDRLALMAEDAEVPVLLSLERIDAAIPLPPTAKRVNLDTDWDQIARYSPKRPSETRSHPNGLAYIIFTSGSTGRPKGTLLQHSGLINYLYYLVSEHDLGAKDVFLQKTPISFDVSVRELFFPFSVGAELVFAVPGGHRDTAYLAEVIAKRGITCCSFVPSQLEVFLQEVDGAACKVLRRVFVSGEALPPTSVAKFLEHLPHAQLHNLYGPTEATVDVTGYDVRLHKGRATVPIGYPIANVKMYVLDPQLRPLPVGVPGELMISSLQLARGYIKRPDLTAEKFIDCPFGEGDYGKMYRTGDLARWLPEGVIEFLGRLDHQVKLRGFRIELGEIENGLCNVPGIRQAVVVVVKDHAGTIHLVGYVTPDDVDIAAAAKELGQHVPEYMVPEVIMPLPELPTLPNGKVNRRGLPEPDFSSTAQMDYTAPRNVIEEEIQDSWHEVFKIQPISVDADFFKIGGNSLLAGKVISRLRQGFGVELPFTSIFQQRTIEDMALFIQSKLQQQPSSGPGEQKRAEDVSIPLLYGEKERCANTPCSYSQELLLFNNELDPFNPVHNEAAWVRLHGGLDVTALVKALRYLIDRHTVLSSHFALAGVAGPMLRQTRPSKFKLPLTYIDLLSGEDIPLPNVANGRTMFKKAVLTAKKANRKERLQKLQSTTLDIVANSTGNQEQSQGQGQEAKKEAAAAAAAAAERDVAHIPVHSLPSMVTQNLAQQIESMQASIPREYGDLRDLRSWLRNGSSPSPAPSGALPPEIMATINGAANNNGTLPADLAATLNRNSNMHRSSSGGLSADGGPLSLSSTPNPSLPAETLGTAAGPSSPASNLADGEQRANGIASPPGQPAPLDHHITSIAEKQSSDSSAPLLNGGHPLSSQGTLSGQRSMTRSSVTDVLGNRVSGQSSASVESANRLPPSTVFGEEPLATPFTPAPAPVIATRQAGSDSARSTGEDSSDKPQKKGGCFPKRDEQSKTPKTPKTPKAKPGALEIEPKSDQIREVEAIASRVKRSLLLHYLTCGIYSVRQSGGTQGFWKGMRENFATLAGYPEAPGKAFDDAEFEGGIMIPELASRQSMASQTLQELLLKESSMHFKIMQGPLIRITLIKVKEDEHVLLLTMHHAVTDGWSYGIIWRELGIAYSAFHEGRSEVDLEPLPIQYADFATWQRRWLAQGTMAEQMKFWRDTMVGSAPQWDFPTDYPRPAVPSGQSARINLSFKPAVVAAMKKLAGQVNATMFMALLAAYNVLLARYSFEENMVCGLPHAGRSRAETEGLIGAFMGAVALRTDLSGNPSFRQVMQRVRKGALEVFEHADTPIHLIMVEVLGLQNMGGCAAPPLFQTMFFLHEASWLEGLEMSGLRAEMPAKVEKNVARFDLTLEMTYDDARNEVAGHIEYRTDLFKRSTLEGMTRHFEVLLDGIVQQPDGCIWDLPLLTAEDSQQIETIRGVPSQLLPSGAVARTARPKILSPRGTPVPPGVPGRLHVSFTAEPKFQPSLASRQSMFGRHGSIMNMISGAGAKFTQMFEEEGPSTGPPSLRKAKASSSKAASPVKASDLVPEWRSKQSGVKKFTTSSPVQESRPQHDPVDAATDEQPSSPFGDSIEMSRWADADTDVAQASGMTSGINSGMASGMGSTFTSGASAFNSGASSHGKGATSSSNRSLPSNEAAEKAEAPKPVEQTIDTGLTARITREGKLEVIGKAANKVTIGMQRVQLEDIDRAILLASYEVAQAATVLMTDPEGEPRLVAYIAPANIDLFQLDVALRQKVPPNLVPRLFQPLRRLPMNTHGEVDRSALPAANWALKVPRVYSPPKSRLEMEVQLIWQAVINKGVISCDADFSEIGGNMMHAVIANGIVREALGVQMPAINIFRDRTIRNVAERIRQLRRRARIKSVA